MTKDMDVFQEPPGTTQLDPDEREGLKFKNIHTRGELNELEQHNIEEGLRWLARQKNPDVLSEDFVRQLHVKLFGDVWIWAGDFRKTDKNIGVFWADIPVALRNLLEDVKTWIEHKVYAPLEIAIRFHHRMVQIHLFPNGNGRHSRIIAEALLEKILQSDPRINWGEEDLIVASEKRMEYLDALRAADMHDYRPLMNLILIYE